MLVSPAIIHALGQLIISLCSLPHLLMMKNGTPLPLSYAFQWSFCQVSRPSCSIYRMGRAMAQSALPAWLFFFFFLPLIFCHLWQLPSLSLSTRPWQFLSTSLVFLTLSHPHTLLYALIVWRSTLPRCFFFFFNISSRRQSIKMFHNIL